MESFSDVLAALPSVWREIRPYWQAQTVLGGLCFGMFARQAYRAYWYFKSRQLISRVLASPTGASPDVGSKMRLMAEADARSLFRSKRNPFAMARRLVELEIINPPLDKPLPDDFSPSEYKSALREWESDEADRIKRILADLRLILSQSKSDFESEWNLPQIYRSIAAFGNRLVGRSTYPVMTGTSITKRSDSATLRSFADLDSRRKLIERYFRVLADIRPNEQRVFATEVQIENGFLSPMFLVTGILNRFDEDNGWKLIIDEYRDLVKKDDVYSTETRELRAFLFNCWLLWGPSIPQCTCRSWITWRDADRQVKSTGAVYQYGYGDENQSIDIIVRDGVVADLEGRLRFNADRLNPRIGFRSMARLAVPYRVQGRFRLGSDLKEHEVCDAQRRIIRGRSGDTVESSEGRIVLECLPSDVNYNEDEKSSNYYSAYLWIIFVIKDQQGRPFFNDAEDNWKNIVCYFEHGNVADATTFQSLKENLAVKAANSIADILLREDALGKPIKVEYACALDDANCKHGRTKYEPEPLHIDPNAASDVRDRISQKKVRIVDMVKAEVLSGRFPYAAKALSQGALLLPDKSSDGGGSEFASCTLPELVAGFYRQLNRAASTQPPT